MAIKRSDLLPEGFRERRLAKKPYVAKIRGLAEELIDETAMQRSILDQEEWYHRLVGLSKSVHDQDDKEFDSILEEVNWKLVSENNIYQKMLLNLAICLNNKDIGEKANKVYNSLLKCENLAKDYSMQANVGLLSTTKIPLRVNPTSEDKDRLESLVSEVVKGDPVLQAGYNLDVLHSAIGKYSMEVVDDKSAEGKFLLASYTLFLEEENDAYNMVRIKNSEEEMGEALKDKPELFDSAVEVYKVYFGKSERELANAPLNAAINFATSSEDERYVGKLINEAKELRDLGCYDDCVEICERINSVRPNKDARYFAGTACMHQGKNEEAIDYFESTLELAPGHSWAKKFLTRLEKSMKEIEELAKI